MRKCQCSKTNLQIQFLPSIHRQGLIAIRLSKFIVRLNYIGRIDGTEMSPVDTIVIVVAGAAIQYFKVYILSFSIAIHPKDDEIRAFGEFLQMLYDTAFARLLHQRCMEQSNHNNIYVSLEIFSKILKYEKLCA